MVTSVNANNINTNTALNFGEIEPPTIKRSRKQIMNGLWLMFRDPLKFDLEYLVVKIVVLVKFRIKFGLSMWLKVIFKFGFINLREKIIFSISRNINHHTNEIPYI